MYKGAPDGNQTILRERLGRLTSPDLLALRGDRQVNLAFDRADDRFIWITDHGERVGLVDQDEAILEWVAPHPGIEPPGPRSSTHLRRRQPGVSHRGVLDRPLLVHHA
jgi:hypothetical protein